MSNFSQKESTGVGINCISPASQVISVITDSVLSATGALVQGKIQKKNKKQTETWALWQQKAL